MQRIMRRILVIGALAASLVSVSLRGQGLPTLEPTGVALIDRPVGTSMMFAIPAVCDGQGNVYLRFHQTSNVVKVSPAGKVASDYSLASVPEADFEGAGKARVSSYTVDERQNVYVAAWNTKDKSVVARFDRDGKYNGLVTLDVPNFDPLKIGFFADGELLVSGFVVNEKDGEEVPGTYTAIFDQYGHLVKNLSLPGDVSSVAADLPSQYEGAPSSLGFEQAIATGSIAFGPDGDAYIVRNTTSPIVFVVSPAGDLVRRMVLNPPAPDLWATSVSMSGTRAAFVFGTPSDSLKGTLSYPKFYSVYDMTAGTLLQSYEASPKLSAAFGCYTQNAFVFVGATPGGQHTLIQAQPQ